MPRSTPDSRDAALRRLGRANRLLIAGAAGLTGVIAVVAADAFPGKQVRPLASISTAGRPATATPAGRSHPRHRPQAVTRQLAGVAGSGGLPPSSPAPLRPPAEAPRSIPAPRALQQAPIEQAPVPTLDAPTPQPQLPAVSGGS